MLNMNEHPITDAAYDGCSSSVLTSELSSEVVDNEEDFDTSKFKRKLETIS